MSANVWPVDAVSSAPSYTGRMLRQLAGLFWARNTARPLCGRSGVIAGTLPTIATATSTTWTVTPFGGVIDGETSAIAGAYNFTFDSNQTGSVNAANATNPRIDLLYVRVSDPSEGDGTINPIIELLYLAGTAAASPVAPATPARSMALATILVPQSGGGSPSVSFVAPWAVAAGGIIPVTGGSAAWPTGVAEGQYLDDATYGIRRFDGANWSTPGMQWQASQVSGSTSLANNVYTTIVMDTLTVNTTGVGIGGGSFRAPVTGTYEVSGVINIAGNSTGVRGGQFALNGSGIDGSYVEIPNNGASTIRLVMPSLLVPCNASDVISMLGFQNSGGALTTQTSPGSRLTVKLI